MICGWKHQPLAVVAALGELRQVLAAVRAVTAGALLLAELTAVNQPLAVVAALEEVRQALALRAAMLAAVESCLHQALAWRRRKQLQHQALAGQHPRRQPWSVHPAYAYLQALPRRRTTACSISRWQCSKQHQHQPVAVQHQRKQHQHQPCAAQRLCVSPRAFQLGQHSRGPLKTW